MRRFSFKLEKVLELRSYVERKWELKLADATRKVLDVQRQIDTWGERRRVTSAIRAGLGPVDMTRLWGREEYLARIDEAVAVLVRRLGVLESERDEMRQGYLEASSKRKALTRLKERRSEEYYKEASRDEGRIIDEIGTSQTVRRITESEEVDV
jgi:flagellar FliJ protein